MFKAMAALIRNQVPVLCAVGFLLLLDYRCRAQPPQAVRPSAQRIAQQGPPEPQPQLRGLEPSDVPPVNQSLDQIRKQSEETTGAIFVEPDEVLVRPPLLKALIQLNTQLSPYQLDADSQTAVSLHDVLKTALDYNLALKISHSDQESSRWQFYSSLTGFLPNLDSGFSYQALKGKFASPFAVLVPINNGFMTIPNNLTYNFFQGGSVLYGALQSKHSYKASQFAFKGATNDVLFDAANLYYQLALNDALLQVRIKAVETAEALLRRNEDRFANGANTLLDVLQAKTLLSRERQQLITQQIARRHAAINLATALNQDTSVDLVVKDRTVAKLRLVDPALRVGDLLKIAIDNRPELKRFEELRLAAKAAIKVARAPLLPVVQGKATAATTGARVGKSSITSQSSAAAGAIAIGAFSPASVAPTGRVSGGEKFTMTELFALGIDIQWTLGGLGLTDAANVQSAKWQARKAQLELNQELIKVYQEVRNSYLDSIDAENLIQETTNAVNSSREQLDVANVRLDEGVGTDLDAVNAQRDYVTALVDKANAIIKFNTAQANLLRAIGRISLQTLTSAIPLRQ